MVKHVQVLPVHRSLPLEQLAGALVKEGDKVLFCDDIPDGDRL